MYQYRHDAVGQTVYKFSEQPTVTEQKDGRGQRTGWHCALEVTITRAHNKLNGNRWEHPTSAYLPQHLDPRYTREQVVSFFMMRHEPQGEAITEATYLELDAKYNAMARVR